MEQTATSDSERYIARGIAHMKLAVQVDQPITVAFVLMPRFTRWFAFWLFPKEQKNIR